MCRRNGLRRAPGRGGRIDSHAVLCLPCLDDSDCELGDSAGGVCASYGGAGRFCASSCDDSGSCPAGYTCVDEGGASVCRSETSSCDCSPLAIAVGASTLCDVSSAFGVCVGERTCSDEGLSECSGQVPGAEVCNGTDDDCDGIEDEPAATDCDVNATCVGADELWECVCGDGYEGDGTSCADVDECAVDNGGCEQDCIDSDGGYACGCFEGYALTVDGITCDDIDECTAESDECAEVCTNTEGGYECDCAAGSSLASDGFGCDACAPGTFDDDSEAITACAACPDGSVQPDSGATSCTACPSGTFGDSTEVCATCAAIANCDAVTCTSGTDQTCVACASGYSVSDSGACVPIILTSDGTRSLPHCTWGGTCAWDAPTQGECAQKLCEASGYAAGAFVSASNDMCTTNFTDETAWFWVVDYDSYVEAAPGLEAQITAACSGECLAGFFAEVGGGCTACAPGSVQPDVAQTTCDVCPAGTFDDGSETCAMCPTGFVQPDAGQTSCDACAAGSYDDGTEVCATCAAIPNCDAVTCTGAGDQTCATCADGFGVAPDGTCAPIVTSDGTSSRPHCTWGSTCAWDAPTQGECAQKLCEAAGFTRGTFVSASNDMCTSSFNDETAWFWIVDYDEYLEASPGSEAQITALCFAD